MKTRTKIGAIEPYIDQLHVEVYLHCNRQNH
jgi:hypothetical protein